jgi:sugar (pentulose or hexulose) kinase
VSQDNREQAKLIEAGQAILGIEFGSTRIKAALIAPDSTLLASGSHTWENQLVDGVWTYDMKDVLDGLASCYSALSSDVRSRFDVELQAISALGISGMMHGYVALDAKGELLVPFRTWRNNITGRATTELTPALNFAVPQRWTVAHFYQSVLEEQSHLHEIARVTTLAGYVHYRLTGEFCVGIGEASGIFPVDATRLDWDSERLSRFEGLLGPRKFPYKFSDLLPRVLPAGRVAGRLTKDGAKLLDRSGKLVPGAPLCPPEGDAGTGMVATNALRPRSGNVSAGTSVFAMVVLEKALSEVHEELDIVATPDGKPVAMAHSNNGSSDLDAWVSLFGQAASALGVQVTVDELYERLLPLALRGEPDAGGLLSINYVSGEHITGFEEGRPLFVRNQDSRFTIHNFVRALYYSSLCAVRMGMNILRESEGVRLDELRGHGGFFKGGNTGQYMMAAALDVPVSISKTAGEGGAWGMAILAAFLKEAEKGVTLPEFVDARLRGSSGTPVSPDPDSVRGFAQFFERHKRGLSIERAAVEVFGS